MTAEDMATARRLVQELVDRAKALRAFIAYDGSGHEDIDEPYDEDDAVLGQTRTFAMDVVRKTEALQQCLEQVRPR